MYKLERNPTVIPCAVEFSENESLCLMVSISMGWEEKQEEFRNKPVLYGSMPLHRSRKEFFWVTNIFIISERSAM